LQDQNLRASDENPHPIGHSKIWNLGRSPSKHNNEKNYQLKHLFN
jgi:hypothetical protein